jgi:hypothetical protein
MTRDFAASIELRDDLRRIFMQALGTGVVLAIVSIIGAFFDPGDFFRSYLMSYLFWWGLTLGAMAIVMMQYLTAGAWGIMTRRTLESASRTMPLIALLFIPVAIGIPYLYDWAHSDLVRKEYVLHHRAVYMNTAFFIGRAIFYFATWGVFTYFLNKWSALQDEYGGFEKRLAKISAPGLILYVFTVTFSSIDWAESLENDWYSTIWGFLFVARQGLTAFGFAIIAMALLSKRQPMASLFKPKHLHDLGKLLLTFVMVWAYFAFSQLVIVWSGNLTDEIPWYLRRFATSWGWLGVMLIVLQFIVPFLLLLSRPLKRNATALCAVVGLLLFMRFVDMMWIVMPSYYQRGFRLSWMNFTVPLAMGGLWIAVFARELTKRPLLPPRAPALERAIEHGEEED